MTEQDQRLQGPPAAGKAHFDRYQASREHIGWMMHGILNAPVDRCADELLGYAHGCEDMAYKLHALANRSRAEADESEWRKLMAL